MPPKGARLLKLLAQHDLIPRHAAPSPADLIELEAYIASEPDLIRLTADKRARQASDRSRRAKVDPAFAARVAHLASHPEEARPEEVSRKLIIAVFVHKYGRRAGGAIKLGGFRCFKGVPVTLTDASGSRTVWQHVDTVCWIDDQGCRHGDLAVRTRRSCF